MIADLPPSGGDRSAAAMDAPCGFDHVQPFQIEAPGLRGRLVRLGPVVEAMLDRHGYPPPVASVLAEALAIGAVLASGLKYDGIFTLQLQGDGPIRLLVVDMTSGGDMRGYAHWDADRLPAVVAADSVVPQLFGAAQLSFTVDQGPNTERYQGITELEGGTLADGCQAYFRRSEQLDTAIRLCASGMQPGAPQRAAALMLQRLPPPGPSPLETEDDAWRRSMVLMSSATCEELLSAEISAHDLLYRLFNEDGVRVFRPRPLRYRCRCSQAKVERTLRAFPLAELQAMSENGVLRVTCEFCKADYAFDERQLAGLTGA